MVRMLFTMLSSSVAFASISSTALRVLASSESTPRRMRANARMDVSGVRSSWLMMAKNSFL